MSSLLGPEGGPAPGTEGTRFGFFTDSSICIGCKACEVACKEWNGVPDKALAFTANSYDNTGSLGADTWRHVTFVEQGTTTPGSGTSDFRWLMSSDVCKHCSSPACLEVCPTGALFTTEFGTIVVQDDICNGCGYCVTACPFGVIERRESDGGAWKCTMCYDRMRGAKEPACAQACPTDSIQFGALDELRVRAAGRLAEVVAAGETRAQLYGDDPNDGVGGTGALFLLLDDPEVYRLPPDPVTPTRHLARMWAMAGAAAGALAAVLAGSLAGGRRR